ncbi:hypothetical protein CCMA1212_001444, partial [Trichoderma ghanense]
RVKPFGTEATQKSRCGHTQRSKASPGGATRPWPQPVKPLREAWRHGNSNGTGTGTGRAIEVLQLIAGSSTKGVCLEGQGRNLELGLELARRARAGCATYRWQMIETSTEGDGDGVAACPDWP